MITAWILYAIVVGTLLAAGGAALEKLFRTHGLAARWIWVVTLLLSVGWPLGHWAWENRLPPAPASVSAPLPVPAPVERSFFLLPAEPIRVQVPSESILHRLNGPVLTGWGLATGLLLIFFGLVYLRTRRMIAGWRNGEIEGEEVLFSDEWGPAVVGLVRPRIVLPSWCEGMDERALRFILDHELEHLRAGDLRLMVLAGIVPVLFPWHLPAWWQLVRLRTAVEADCDARVLGRNPGQIGPYLHLLLDVGERASPSPAFAAMLSEPYETLKRRITIMTMPLPKRPLVRGGILLGVGIVLLALACWAPGPSEARSEDSESPVEPAEADVAAQDEQGFPIFTPYTVHPTIANAEEVTAALERDYPADLKAEGIGGTVQVWFFMDENDRVIRTLVNVSSRHRALDNAAIRIADIIEFTPALNRDQHVPVWVSLPIEFVAGDAPEMEVPVGGRGAERNAPEAMTAPQEITVEPGGPTGEIRGIVTDAATGQPLQFAQLYVPGTGRGTLTNPEGRFIIEGVPEGNRELVGIMLGFGEGTGEATVRPGAPAEVSLQLEPEAITLEKLVIRGMR